jgi:hypothetical protein
MYHHLHHICNLFIIYLYATKYIMQTVNNYELFPNLQAIGLLELAFFLVINAELAVLYTIPENVFQEV